MSSPSQIIRYLSVILASVGGSCSSPPTPNGMVNGTIDGQVMVTGPVAGVVVSAYALDLDTGKPGAVIATSAPTPSSGLYHIELGSHAGPVLLVAKGVGGTYIEPSSGVTAHWDSSTQLRAIYVDWTPAQDLDFEFQLGTQAHVILSPFSDWSVAYAAARLASRRDSSYASALDSSLRRWRDHLELDFWSVVPSDLGQRAGTWGESVQAGLAYAAMSQLMLRMAQESSISPAGLSSLQLVATLDQDLADSHGQLDGAGVQGGLQIGTCATICKLSPKTMRANWSEAAADFLGSTANKSGITVTDAQAFLARVSARQSDLWPGAGDPSFDTSPPSITVMGLQEADIVHDTVTATVRVFDAIEMGEVTVTFARGGNPATGFYTATPTSPDAQTRIVTLSIRSKELTDGPLLFSVRAKDKAGNTAPPIDLSLFLDNSPNGILSGTVVLGGRVVGARVRAWEYPGATRGKMLGETTTDGQGLYQVTVMDTTADVILVEADNPGNGSGANYIEATSGYKVVFSSDDVISTIVTGWKNGDKRSDAMVTSWTTVGRSFAEGLLISPLYNANKAQWTAAVEDAFKLLEDHFAEGATRINLRAVQPADLSAPGVSTFNAQARYGYINAALGTLADQQAMTSNTTSASLNTLTLTKLLAQDIGKDGMVTPLLNGRTGSGQLVSGRVNLDSYVTRVDLATAAVAALTNPRIHVPFTELDVDPLLDKMSADANPRLYPANEPPIPYDKVPPTAAFTAPTPLEGTVLRGVVPIQAQAMDNRALLTLAWETTMPPATDAIVGVHLDRGNSLAGPWVLTGMLNTDLLPEGEVKVSAKATDEASNTASTGPRTLVVDRTPPMITVTGAKTSSGSALASGGWTGPTTLTISGTLVEPHPATATYTLNGTTSPLVVTPAGAWTISVPMPATGTYTVTLGATDAAGNSSSAGPLVYNCDATPPTVTVVASSFQDDTGREATVTGDGPGEVTWSQVGSVVPLSGGTTSHFSKYETRYTNAGPSLPEWHWSVSDNHSAAGSISLSARLSRKNGTVILKDWFQVSSTDGSGYNRAQIVSSALHADVAVVSDTYTLEFRATDEFGNTAAIASVNWAQQIIPPPLRQRPGTDGCQCGIDPSCPSYYTLDNSTCSGPKWNASGILTTNGNLKIAEGYIDNPNAVPVRVTLRIQAPATIRRGLSWQNAQTDSGTGPGTSTFCNNDPSAATLVGGGCYDPHVPGEYGTSDVLDRDVFDSFQVTGASEVGTAPGGLTEYEIPAGSTATVWVLARSYAFLMPTLPMDYETVGTLSHVTGTVEADWLKCTGFHVNPDDSMTCTSHADYRTINQLTRGKVDPVTSVTLFARPSADEAIAVPASGTDVNAFSYANFNWDSHAAGYSPL